MAARERGVSLVISSLPVKFAGEAGKLDRATIEPWEKVFSRQAAAG